MKANSSVWTLSSVRSKWDGFRIAQLSVVGIFALIMGLPVLFLMLSSFNVAPPGSSAVYGLQNWTRAFSDTSTLNALWMSFVLSAVRLIPATILAVVVAWLIARTDIPGGGLIEFLCWFAYFVPDFPLTLAWILLLDPNFGFLNSLLRTLHFSDGSIFNPYGFWGIVWVHLATDGIWFKVMLLTPIFRRLGASLEEASHIAGADMATTLRRITLPLLSPIILAIVTLSFIRGLESFNTELLLGIPAGIYVYATRIYDYTRQEPPAFGEATALGSVLLAVLAVLFFFYQRYLKGKSFTVVGGQGYSTLPVKLGRWRYPALWGCLLYFSLTMGLPLAFLLIGSFMRRYGFFHLKSPFTFGHWQSLFSDPIFFVSLKNSFVIATVTALAGILLYSSVGYLLVAKRFRAASLLDFLCWLPWVLPGILMSLGLLWLFLATPLRGFLFGSVWGIALAMLIKDSPVSTQAFKAAFLQLSPEFEEAARVSGGSWPHIYRKILFPLVAPVAAAVGLLNFGSALTNISTPVLLYSAQSRPLSILLLEYSVTGELERAAALGVLITAVISLMMLAGRKVGLHLTGS
ncbi:MAG: iron ABC transporter permease [Deltaproteobacteria bacterium]|nr:MAG: iron ABC transporter permease [Deltaproteobacteria bacterium]